VEQQDRRRVRLPNTVRALLQIVHPQAAALAVRHLRVMGGERELREAFESLVRCP
jgi:hypothetical protein